MASRPSKPDFWSVFHVTLPAGLQRMTLGRNFDHNLDNVTWPAGIESLTFASCSRNVFFYFQKRPTGWPRSLRELVFQDLKLVC